MLLGSVSGTNCGTNLEITLESIDGSELVAVTKLGLILLSENGSWIFSLATFKLEEVPETYRKDILEVCASIDDISDNKRLCRDPALTLINDCQCY